MLTQSLTIYYYIRVVAVRFGSFLFGDAAVRTNTVPVRFGEKAVRFGRFGSYFFLNSGSVRLGSYIDYSGSVRLVYLLG